MARISYLPKRGMACLAISVVVILFSCSKNTPSPGLMQTLTPREQELTGITASQKRCDSLVHAALAASSDTAQALAEVATMLNADSLIDSAVASEQGIAVQYVNGMRGGIFLRPMDDTLEGGTIPEAGLKLQKKWNVGVSALTSKQAILWAVHYNERVAQTAKIIEFYEKYLPMSGYTLSKKLGTVNLDDLCSLSTKDYIHIYSHGWAWPKASSIYDVYLMTNQQVDVALSARYWDDIQAGNIVTAGYKGTQVYFVNSRFLARHNTFKADCLFYGGFCFSFLGQWPQAIMAAGVSAYTGFTWSVNTNYNAWWARTIAEYMADTSDPDYPLPITLEYWYDSLATVKKFYHDDAAHKDVYIHYTGNSLLTLWGRIHIDSILPIRGGSGSSVTIKGFGFGESQGTAVVTFNGTAATVDSWSEKTITVTVPAAASSGQVLVNRAALRSNGVRFTIGGPFIAKITPDTSHANDSVVITGEKFGKGGKVMFGALSAQVVGGRWDSTRIAVYVPAGAAGGLVRVLAQRVSEYNVYDTSNAYAVTIAVPRPVLTIVKPPFALADSSNYFKIGGNWWRRSPTPNSFAKIAGTPLATDYWSYDTMRARLNPLIPWGNQKLSVSDETVESNSLDVYIGIPLDTIAKTALYGRCAFTVLVKTVEPGGTSLTMTLAPGGSVTFTPVTWEGRNFSFVYVTPGNDIIVSFRGRLGQFGTTVDSLCAHFTRTSGDEYVISMATGKSMQLQAWYRGNFTNQFSWSDGFQPPLFEVPRDSIPGSVNVAGTLNVSGVIYTIQSVTGEGSPMFPLEFKKNP